MPFPPSLHPTPAKHTSLPPLHPPPWCCPCVLYSTSCNPLYPLSLPPPPTPTLAIVRLFLTSMSLVIFCLLFSSVDYIPVKGEIIWYLSLTAWFISLSIMLSSSIHAVKGLISKYIKNSHDSTPGRQTTQLENGQRTWTDTSPRKTYRGPRDIWKDAQHH